MIIPPLRSIDWFTADCCPRCRTSLTDQPTPVAHPLAVRLQLALLAGRARRAVEWPAVGRLDWPTAIALIDVLLGLLWNGSNADLRRRCFERIESDLDLAKRLGSTFYDGLLLAWLLEEWPARVSATISSLKVLTCPSNSHAGGTSIPM